MQGVSRSASFAVARRMRDAGEHFSDALQHVRKGRGIAQPNIAFACQLMEYGKLSKVRARAHTHSWPLTHARARAAAS